VALLLIVE